jgi:coenzyme F420 hydrogenase subunit delta
MDSIPARYRAHILVLGCGNILFGDDGFGPAAVKYLEGNYEVPENICVVDAGTGVREILFDILLSEKKPERIIIVDSVSTGMEPGKIFEISVEDMPENKISDFSLHQFPTSNLLRELKEICNVDVRLIVAQTEDVPEAVKPGLSKRLADSIPPACEMILKAAANKM